MTTQIERDPALLESIIHDIDLHTDALFTRLEARARGITLVTGQDDERSLIQPPREGVDLGGVELCLGHDHPLSLQDAHHARQRPGSVIPGIICV